jgi:hypothetical protein
MNAQFDQVNQPLGAAIDAGSVPAQLEQAIHEHLTDSNPKPDISEQALDGGGPPPYLVPEVESSLEGEVGTETLQISSDTALDGGGCSPDLIASVEGVEL